MKQKLPSLFTSSALFNFFGANNYLSIGSTLTHSTAFSRSVLLKYEFSGSAASVNFHISLSFRMSRGVWNGLETGKSNRMHSPTATSGTSKLWLSGPNRLWQVWLKCTYSEPWMFTTTAFSRSLKLKNSIILHLLYNNVFLVWITQQMDQKCDEKDVTNLGQFFSSQVILENK